MMLTDQQIEDLQGADLTARAAKAVYDQARVAREREIRRVAAEGGTYRDIAEASGVTYQRVAQIVTGKEPPHREQDDFMEFECSKCGAQPGERCDSAGLAHHERHIAAIEAFRAAHPELG